MKREENMKYWKKYIFIFYFFQYLKTFHQYQKLYSTPPWHGARTCKVSRKYINAFFSYCAKTKRDGQTDGRTDGRGALQYLPSRAFGTAGDKNSHQENDGWYPVMIDTEKRKWIQWNPANNITIINYRRVACKLYNICIILHCTFLFHWSDA